MALEMFLGTEVPIVEVLKLALDKYIEKKYNYLGMCFFISKAAQELITDKDTLKEVENYSFGIPKFNKQIATKHFGAQVDELSGYWWHATITEPRIKYFKWLINEYSNEI